MSANPGWPLEPDWQYGAPNYGVGGPSSGYTGSQIIGYNLSGNYGALVSVPNLAHLQSRVHFLRQGRLIRTAALAKHPGDRPFAEYLQLVRSCGFDVVSQRGIFPTVPVLAALVRRHPVSLHWLHAALTRLCRCPGGASST